MIHNTCMHQGISFLIKYVPLRQQDDFACIQGSIWPIYKWHEWFVMCAQISDTLLTAYQLRNLFLSSVLVFEKLFLPSFCADTMPQ